MSDAIINIFVVVLLGAILLPIAFSQVFNANTTGWDSNTVTIFGLIPIISIIALILVLIYAYYTKNGA